MLQVYENTRVFGDAQVCDSTWISGDTYVCGYARIWGKSKLSSGICNQVMEIDDHYYLISITLEKICVYEDED